jgi:LysM repeat protein
MRKIAMMLLVTAVGVGFASGSAHAAEVKPEQKEQPKKHIVASGDSLSTIATANQLESWRPIWNANPELTNPDVINVGQELVIPKEETTERPLPAGYGEPVAVVTQPVKQSGKTYQPAARRVVPTGGDVFARIRAKESGGNYSTNTGNGYYGAYQFSLGTWRGVGGTGLPSDASPAEQDMRAQMLYNQRGCSPWPNTCY